MNVLWNALVRGGVYRVLRALPLGLVLALAAIALVVVVVTANAGAATYTTSCPPVGDPPLDTQVQCAALAERIEANTVAVELQVENDRAHAGYVVGAVAGTGFVVMLLTVAFGPRGA